MKLISVEELWNFGLAIARKMDNEALFESNQLALQAKPLFKARLRRLREQIWELIDAGGSQRDVVALVPQSWRQEGISFPKTEKECNQVAHTLGILLTYALREMLGTSPQELAQLVAEALRKKQDNLDEFVGIRDKYYHLSGDWLCRHINHGAAALADFYFCRLRIGTIPLVELITLNLEQSGMEGAKKAIDEIVRAEDCPYYRFIKEYGELLELLMDRIESPSPRAAAELIVASLELIARYEATFYRELAQRDSKLRRAIIKEAAFSMGGTCKKWLAELESLFGAIECRNDLRRSEIDFDMNKALALDIILDYKRRKISAKRRREPYERLSALCEVAGADYEYVQAFAVELGLLPKRGRPRNNLTGKRIY